MEIRYKNTLADLFKFTAYHLSKSLIFKILIPVTAFLIIQPAYQVWHKMHVPLVFILIPIAMNIVVFMVIMSIAIGFALVASYLPRLNKTLLTEHKLVASEAGLIEETEFNRTESKWKGILQIRQSRDYIFIYTSQNAAHVVPKRAFSDPMQEAAFFEAIKRWQGAPQTPPIAQA